MAGRRMTTRISAAEGKALLSKTKRSKYGNRKTEWAGMKFDSLAEARRAAVLFMLQNSGDIKKLRLQPVYHLWHPDYDKPLCKYIGDFEYFDVATQELVTEDVKGVETAVFKLKAKLFEANTGRKIRVTK